MENCVANSVQEQAAPVPQPPSWTEERVNLLREMANHRWSAQEIANKLGVSRFAVIGKAHREKINLLYQKKTRRPKRWTDDMVSEFRALAKDGLCKNAISRALDISAKAIERCANREGIKLKRGFIGSKGRVRRAVPAPDSLRIPILDLRRDQCRYAVTDDKPHLFCGQPVEKGSSYCEFHTNICTTPSSWRR